MSLIRIYIILTFIYGLFLKKKRGNPLIFILLISVGNELCLQYTEYDILTTNIYIFFIFPLWLLILLEKNKLKEIVKIKKYLIIGYILICFLSFYKSFWTLHFYNFTIGSLLYCSIFLLDSYYNLKKENFGYFTSNHYLLISSPVIFFLGMSFLFAFGSSELLKIKVYKEITIYIVVADFVNIIYYSLINCYIHKENKSHVHV